jgi:hypothetical protein
MKNYTSSVPVERTISRIEYALANAGARNIIKDYANGELTALSFTLCLPGSAKMVPIRLPANAEAVEKVLLSEVKRPRTETLERIRQQSLRTAWKLMQDWVEVQISLIELQGVEALQVFLPYIWDGRRTYYAALKDGGFKMLPQGRPGEEG